MAVNPVILKFIWKYKFQLLALLAFLIVIIGLSIKIADLQARNVELVKQYAQAQNVIKETESAYSQYVVVAGNIEKSLINAKDSYININKELLKNIKQKDEEIVLANKTILKLKKQVVNSQPGGGGDGPIVIVTDPDKPCKDTNVRVEFKGKKSNVSVAGYTESNPPKFETEIQIDPISLNIFVTKNKENQPVFYADTNDPDITIGDMKTIVDESLFPKRKPHNINALINYNTSFIAGKEWQGVELGVQYIHTFEKIPINLGFQLEAGFAGDVTLGLTLGGRP